MAELQQLQAPRIELEQQLPLQTWNRDVQYANFMLYNPENCVQDIVHRSDEILFDETPLHIGMKYNGEEIGIFIYPRIPGSFRFIFYISLYGDAAAGRTRNRVCCTARQMNPNETSWGFPKVVRMEEIQTLAQNHRTGEANTVYVPPESRPAFSPFVIRSKLIVRFVSVADWDRLGADMVANPSRYLYIQPRSDSYYPRPPPPAPPIKDRMRKMLRDADPNQKGVFTFLVGKDKVPMYAHDCIVRMALAVPIRNENMIEGALNVVALPEAPVEEFRALLEYMYTQEMPAPTLRKYAVGLMGLSHQYLDPILFHKCETYLCYKVHTSPLDPGLFTILAAADQYGAKQLKRACFEAVFNYGQHLLQDKALEALDPRLLVELLRDIADQRATHIPEPVPPPPAEREEEEPPAPSDDDYDDETQPPYKIDAGGRRLRTRKRSAPSSSRGPA